MRLYIAGGSDERLTVVRPFIDRMIDCGVTITHDWTRCEGYDREHTDEERRTWALADAKGVESSDLVWIIVPDAKSEGAATEIGIARGRRIQFIASGTRARGNIFVLLAASIFDTHDAAFGAIVEVHEKEVAQAKELRQYRASLRARRTEST